MGAVGNRYFRRRMKSLLACLLLSACTITPHTVRPGTVSFSEGQQNSSIVSFDATGAILDAHGRDRYNALIDAYGASFALALKPDEGLTPQGARWHIDDEHLSKFAQMNLWRRSGVAPVKRGLIERVKDAL